jgi:hypothetical protein
MTLSIELTTGPLSAEIAPYLAIADDASCDTIVGILNRKDISVHSKIDWATFSQWLVGTSVRADIEDWKVNANRSVRALAFSISDGIIRGTGAIDFSLAENITMASGLVALGLLSQNNADSLLALSNINISRAQQALGADVSLYDVKVTIFNDDGTRKI